jgi:hypothetical protein
MTSEIQARRAARDAERKSKLSPGSIIGGLIAFGIILLAAPPLLLFLPFALIGLVILYKVGGKSARKSETLARSKPGAGALANEVSIGVGNASALVLNDWGIVWTTPGSKPIELAWSDVASVEEPLTAMLAFHSRTGHAFSVDLSAVPFLQVARKVSETIPHLAHLDLDPLTGESLLWERLRTSPREWSGRWGTFRVTTLDVRRNGVEIRWDEVTSVVEDAAETDEGPSTWGLTFNGLRASVRVTSHELDDDRPAGFTRYDWLRAAALERLPDRTSVDWRRPIPTPRERARLRARILPGDARGGDSARLRVRKARSAGSALPPHARADRHVLARRRSRDPQLLSGLRGIATANGPRRRGRCAGAARRVNRPSLV